MSGISFLSLAIGFNVNFLTKQVGRPLEVVSENSEADIARHRALAEVNWALRNLGANILRVVRGAGKSYDLGPQAVELVDALLADRDAAGCYPSAYELDRALDINPDAELLDGISEDESEKLHAERKMIRGALQIAASRLLSQRTQEAAGHSELFDGIQAIEAYRERRNKERVVAMRAVAPKKPRKPARRRPLAPKAKKRAD